MEHMQFHTTQTIEATSWMSTITPKDVTKLHHYVQKRNQRVKINYKTGHWCA